jgi:hypothetical protein
MKIVNASRARVELFQLMEHVAGSDAEAVVIRRRGSQEGVALVREGYLKLLEARVRAADATANKSPFKLIGSVRVNGDVEAMVRESREAEAQAREARLLDLYR